MRFLCLIVAFSSFVSQLHGMSTVILRFHNQSGIKSCFSDVTKNVSLLKGDKLGPLDVVNTGCCEYCLIRLNDSENMPKEGYLSVRVNNEKFNLRFFAAEGGSIIPRFDKEVFDREQNQFVITQADFTITRKFDSASNVYDIFINKNLQLQDVQMEEQPINEGKKNKRFLKSSCIYNFLSKVWH